MILEKMLRAAAPDIRKIKNHPWNEKMLNGDLPFDKFMFYIEQDALYLHDFSCSVRHIAQRLSADPDTIQYGVQFNHYANDIHRAEKNLHDQYFPQKKTLNFFQSIHGSPKKITVINDYTSHQLNAAQFDSVEVAIASVIPCYWIYKELGIQMNIPTCSLSHPYKKWMETYSDPAFVASTGEIIEIMEQLVRNKPNANQEKIIHAFVKSTAFERAFFDRVHDGAPEKTVNHHDALPLFKAETLLNSSQNKWI